MHFDEIDRSTSTDFDAFFSILSDEEIISHTGCTRATLKTIWGTYCGPGTALCKGTDS